MKIKILIIIFIFTVWSLLYIYDIWIHINKLNKKPLYVEIHWNSMYPTLKNWEKYRIEEINWCDWSIKRWDIVMFDILWSDIKYIKRAKILPWDDFEIQYENNWWVLDLILNWNQILKFKNYRNTKFYKTLLIWSNNTNKWTVTSKQYAVFWDNKNNSVDTLEYWFIGCTKITHKMVLDY